MNEIIKKCESLEKELSQYKLRANLIPQGSFGKNFRKFFLKNEWDRIREAVYKKDNYKCSICGKENTNLEAHENWKYYYKQSIQQLDAINALCYMCHRNKHLGHSQLLIFRGVLNENALISHWLYVNGINKDKFNGVNKDKFNRVQIKLDERGKLKNRDKIVACIIKLTELGELKNKDKFDAYQLKDSELGELKNKDKFDAYQLKVRELGKLKNKFTWKILDNKGIEMHQKPNLNNILELTK